MSTGTAEREVAREPSARTGAGMGAETQAPSEERSHRWAALTFIALAQLMVALDATIVSIALPSAQASLHATDAERQWVVTAYAMAFGGLLLLGGKIADRLGRKRTFLLGLAGFVAASAFGGAAPSFEMLVAARAVQGAFAALLTPTALSLLAVTFTEPRERATAFAVYGSIAGSGAAFGLLLGGALTQYLTWRWCLYVNIPIAVIAAVGGGLVLSVPRSGGRVRLDLQSAALATSALVALVYGCTQAVTAAWTSGVVIGPLVASAVLFLGFVLRQVRARNPLLPLQIVLDRNRGGAYVSVLLAIAGLFGAFLFITYYLQVVRGFSPLEAGVAFLPITVASQTGSWLIARRLMPRVPPRTLIAPGLLVAALGMGLLTQLHVNSDYMSLVLPAEILLGFGIACAMVPAFSAATLGVDQRQAGIAAAAVNTAQQVGASIGTALLNTIAASATITYLGTRVSGPVRPAALVHGYSVATAWGAGILVLGAIAAAAMINAAKPPEMHSDSLR